MVHGFALNYGVLQENLDVSILCVNVFGKIVVVGNRRDIQVPLGSLRPPSSVFIILLKLWI